MSRLLGLDLGTHLGFALDDNGKLVSGEVDFSLRRGEGEGMRIIKFRRFLRELGPIDACYYELVRNHKGVQAAHLYGAFYHLLQEFFAEVGLTVYRGITVQDAKKRATGKGNASKEAMIAAAQTQWPEQEVGPKQDNRADALWVLLCGKENVGL